ncbi:VPS9 domain-containing protein 1-like isoform X2 [Sylvia atricapilla]|uniref:VPS9 domain-containing protein 1-like isoform X2 n=1 Tax=Sylvia atricapilla TaxID=48155 RepID=UPI0033934FC8
MMENLVIAKAREETLQRKMEERRLRLQEAANRRFSSSVALTPEEQEQRALYAAILEYEQDHVSVRQGLPTGLEAVPWDRRLCHGAGCCTIPVTSPGHSPGLAKAVEGAAEAEPGRSLSCVRALLLPPEVLPGVGTALPERGGCSHCCCPLPTPSLCPQLPRAPHHAAAAGGCSVRCTPGSTPAVSHGPTDASPASPSGPLLPVAGRGGLLAARRARGPPAPSVPQPAPACFRCPSTARPALRHSQSSTPLADSGTPGPAEPPETPRESSFEDLERFLASPEGWTPTEPPASSWKDAALPELLKGVVRDIHNAIDRLLALTLLAFRGLGTAAGKDQCLACLEEAFFPHSGPRSWPSTGPCSSPVRRPWHGAWSDTGTPAPPTWGWPHASSHRPRPPRVRLRRARPAPHPAGDVSPQEAGVHRASPAWHLRVCRGVLRQPGRPEPRHGCHRGRRPAANPVLRGAADGAAPAALRVCCPGGVHP